MQPGAVRASGLFVLHANACATAYAATQLFVNRALPVSLSWLTLVSAAEVLFRLVVLWTTQWRSLAWRSARHVSPREYAPSLPAQIRPLGSMATFLHAHLPGLVQLFLVLA
jgi:hypothetical protein